MINPQDYQNAISSVRFLVGVSQVDRQYTFAEVSVRRETSRDIEIMFYVPDGSDPRDEKELVEVMGGSPVNDALDCWDLRVDPDACPNHVSTVKFEQLDDTNSMSSEVSGCKGLAVVAIPRGPCTVNVCWSHKAHPRSLFVPTQNEHISEWRVEIVAIDGYAESSGRKGDRPLARGFRFDIAFTKGVVFGNLDNSILISRYGAGIIGY